jgi:hypothetical protein
VQVCTDVTDCTQGDSCTRVGFGGNALMECVAPPPPQPDGGGTDAGADAARPVDAGRDAAAADAEVDSGPRDANTGG